MASWHDANIHRPPQSTLRRPRQRVSKGRFAALAFFILGGLSAQVAADPLSDTPSLNTPTPVPTAPAAHSAEARAAQLLTLQPRAQVSWQPFTRRPAQIVGLELPVPGATAEARSWAFLEQWHGLLDFPLDSLEYTQTTHAKQRQGVRYQQTWKGMRVLNRSLVVSVDDAGHIRSFASDLVPLGEPVQGEVGEAQAAALAIAVIHGEDAPLTLPFRAERAVLAEPGLALVVWRVRVPRRPMADNLIVLIDSRDGKVIHVENRVWK